MWWRDTRAARALTWSWRVCRAQRTLGRVLINARIGGPLSGGGFNGSAQHLLIFFGLDEGCRMVTSRIWFTAQQKADLWERWRNGQSAAAISRALERRNKTGVEKVVVRHGGIAPAPRRRAVAALRF